MPPEGDITLIEFGRNNLRAGLIHFRLVHNAFLSARSLALACQLPGSVDRTKRFQTCSDRKSAESNKVVAKEGAQGCGGGESMRRPVVNCIAADLRRRASKSLFPESFYHCDQGFDLFRGEFVLVRRHFCCPGRIQCSLPDLLNDLSVCQLAQTQVFHAQFLGHG